MYRKKKKIFVLRTTFLYGSLTYFIWHQVKTKVIIFVLFNFLRHGNDDRWLHGWWIATILLWLMNLARQSSPAYREHDRRIFCDSHPHTAFIWTGTETIKKIFASLRMDYNLATHSSRNDFFNIQSDERRNKCSGTSLIVSMYLIRDVCFWSNFTDRWTNGRYLPKLTEQKIAVGQSIRYAFSRHTHHAYALNLTQFEIENDSESAKTSHKRCLFRCRMKVNL